MTVAEPGPQSVTSHLLQVKAVVLALALGIAASESWLL